MQETRKNFFFFLSSCSPYLLDYRIRLNSNAWFNFAAQQKRRGYAAPRGLSQIWEMIKAWKAKGRNSKMDCGLWRPWRTTSLHPARAGTCRNKIGDLSTSTSSH